MKFVWYKIRKNKNICICLKNVVTVVGTEMETDMNLWYTPTPVSYHVIKEILDTVRDLKSENHILKDQLQKQQKEIRMDYAFTRDANKTNEIEKPVVSVTKTNVDEPQNLFRIRSPIKRHSPVVEERIDEILPETEAVIPVEPQSKSASGPSEVT